MTRADDLKPDLYNTPQVHTMYTPINKLLMQGVVDSWIRLSASLAVWAFCLTVTACAGVEHKDTLPIVASVSPGYRCGFSGTALTRKPFIPAVRTAGSEFTMSVSPTVAELIRRRVWRR